MNSSPCIFTASQNDRSEQIVTTKEVWTNLKEKLELKENGESKVLPKVFAKKRDAKEFLFSSESVVLMQHFQPDIASLGFEFLSGSVNPSSSNIRRKIRHT